VANAVHWAALAAVLKLPDGQAAHTRSFCAEGAVVM
jgi:hypothetical protein